MHHFLTFLYLVALASCTDALSSTTANTGSSGICSSDGWCWSSPLPQGNTLNGMWGTSASDIWAVGDVGTILHYDGTAWSSAPIDPSLIDGSLGFTAVWGIAPNDAWTVGSNKIVHWDGSTWSLSATIGLGLGLNSVWASDASNAWAVGYNGSIVSWNGSSWSVVPSGTTEFLAAVWGNSPSDVWASGANDTIVHWDGSTWTTTPSGTTGSSIASIWTSGPNDAWAVATGSPAAVLHWDGTSWSQSFSDPSSFRPFPVGGSAANDVWAAGASPTGDQKLIHWDGTTWTAYLTGARGQLFGVWSAGPNDAWAVGGAIGRRERRDRALGRDRMDAQVQQHRRAPPERLG